MDSVPLEMDDIFGEIDGEDDDEGFNPSRLPDLEDELEPMRDMRQDEGNEEDDEMTDNAELLAKLKSMKGASKNTTKRSMPKLDATRLTGERGMAILPKAFERVPLKGRNHEAEDLKLIMHTLQHWGHRLFPKMTFDEILERVERLGAKKEVQTCLKKIRLDMPVLASDMVEDEEDTIQRMGDENEPVPSQREGDENEPVSRAESRQDVSRLNGSHDEISDEELEDLLRDQGQPVASLPVTPLVQNLAPPKGNTGLSEEARKRIEENKRKAMERRAAKAAASNKKGDAAVSTNGSLINGDLSLLSDKDGDISNTTENVEMAIPKVSHPNTTEENQTNVIPCPERLSPDTQTGSVPVETGPFQTSKEGEDAMLYEVTEMPSDDENCASSKVEEDLTLKAQEQEEVKENDHLSDKCIEVTEASKQKQDEDQCNSSEVMKNCEEAEEAL